MQAILTALSGALAVGPILIFLYLIWWLDRYDREPVGVLLLAFGWGAVGGVLFSILGSSALMIPVEAMFGEAAAASIGAVVIAPLVEEPMKALVLLPIAASKHFDNTTDGFVYGAAAGLGFGMTENFLYFVDSAATGDLLAWAGTVAIRTLYSALMHGCATSVVGAALGLARFRGPLAMGLAVPAGLSVAVAIHALWNGLLTLDALAGGGGSLTVVNLLLFPLEFAVLFAVLQFCLWDESRTIHRELAGEVISGLIPPDHVPVLASYFKRQGGGWLEAGVDRRAYVRAATTLAFRKHQARLTKREGDEEEVTAQRAAVAAALRG
jgi:RsiW-degrading membrane proteinase PrsW (M82 family)